MKNQGGPVMQDVFFQGIAAPARFVAAADLVGDLLGDLVGDLAQVTFGWPFRLAKVDPLLRPFYEIRAEPGSDRLTCESSFSPGKLRRFDRLNALCDLVAALAFALPQADPRLICLHAAAVRVSGHLVIFPNVRRAGKSTLSVALARSGHEVISDDVVPLSFDRDGLALALAMGVSPRLRLPLPAVAPVGFRDWLDQAPGLRNRQYQYVLLPGQPVHGARFAVESLVILDRHEAAMPARIDPMSADQAMDVLLFQNFTRDRHSGDVLRAVAGMLARMPVYRLGYSELDDAVRCLEGAFATPAFATPAQAAFPGDSAAARPFRLVLPRPHKGATIRPAAALHQRPGTEAQMIGDTLYLADPEGRAIHRMDPLAATIWGFIAEPATQIEIGAILAQAFPGTDAGQIDADLVRLLRKWSAAGLIAVA